MEEMCRPVRNRKPVDRFTINLHTTSKSYKKDPYDDIPKTVPCNPDFNPDTVSPATTVADILSHIEHTEYNDPCSANDTIISNIIPDNFTTIIGEKDVIVDSNVSGTDYKSVYDDPGITLDIRKNLPLKIKKPRKPRQPKEPKEPKLTKKTNNQMQTTLLFSVQNTHKLLPSSDLFDPNISYDDEIQEQPVPNNALVSSHVALATLPINPILVPAPKKLALMVHVLFPAIGDIASIAYIAFLHVKIATLGTNYRIVPGDNIRRLWLMHANEEYRYTQFFNHVSTIVGRPVFVPYDENEGRTSSEKVMMYNMMLVFLETRGYKYEMETVDNYNDTSRIIGFIIDGPCLGHKFFMTDQLLRPEQQAEMYIQSTGFSVYAGRIGWKTADFVEHLFVFYDCIVWDDISSPSEYNQPCAPMNIIIMAMTGQKYVLNFYPRADRPLTTADLKQSLEKLTRIPYIQQILTYNNAVLSNGRVDLAKIYGIENYSVVFLFMLNSQ